MERRMTEEKPTCHFWNTWFACNLRRCARHVTFVTPAAAAKWSVPPAIADSSCRLDSPSRSDRSQTPVPPHGSRLQNRAIYVCD